MKLNRWCLILSILFTSFSGYAKNSEDLTVRVGGGITSPSEVGTIFDNPASLVNRAKPILAGQLLLNDSFASPTGFSGGGLMSNGPLGVGAMVTHVDQSNWADAGLAGMISAIHTSLGLGVYIPLSSLPGSASLLYSFRTQISQSFVMGAVYRPLASLLQAGLSYSASNGLRGVLDAEMVTNKSSFRLKPGLGYEYGNLNLGLSYGFDLNGAPAASTFGRDWAYGLGFRFSGKYAVSFSHNDRAFYLLELSGQVF